MKTKENAASNPESTQFGFAAVDPDEKTGLVRGVFDSVADKYDLMNDVMSGGLHRLWKDRFVRAIRPRPDLAYLDVAGGTGDIAFRIRQKAGGATAMPITIFDLNENMLRVGQDRAADRGWIDGFDWVTGNAETLPFPDESFDVYTIAFGLRNVTRIDTALREAARVLRPGGRFFCLEFSHVEQPALKKLYDTYSFQILPRMGRMIANDDASYRYLAESIRKFPAPRILARRMEDAGMTRVRHEALSAGMVCIHKGLKA